MSQRADWKLTGKIMCCITETKMDFKQLRANYKTLKINRFVFPLEIVEVHLFQICIGRALLWGMFMEIRLTLTCYFRTEIRI